MNILAHLFRTEDNLIDPRNWKRLWYFSYSNLCIFTSEQLNNKLLTGQVENSENSEILEISGIFFLRFLSPSFRFWVQGKIENLEIRKLGKIVPRFFRFTRSTSFLFATFPRTLIFNILQYAIPYFLSMSCFVFKAFQKVFSFTKNIYLKYYLVLMRYICCEMYLSIFYFIYLFYSTFI